MNALATFQRCTEEYPEGLRDDSCVPYLDDNPVYRRTFEEYVEHVREISSDSKKYSIELKAEKCDLFKMEVWV